MTQQDIEVYLPKYIGIPYREKDCYDLIRLYHKNVFGNTLPDLEYSRPDGANLKERDIDTLGQVAPMASKSHFYQVTKPKHGDIILIRIFNMPLHVGLYLNESQFLHTQKQTGSCVERIDTWKKRILGFYRYDQGQV